MKDTLSPADANKRWICTECGFIGVRGEFDHITDPKFGDDADGWTICPKCRAADHVADVCDEPGCNQEASCGWNSPKSYRRTCWDHSIFKVEADERKARDAHLP